MQCPKCHEENPQTVKFCRRCHTPLSFTCPACHHVQSHGGTCDQCGVDLVKIALAFQTQMKVEADRSRERLKERSGWIRQIVLLPITGGFSLIKFFRNKLRGE